MQKISKLSIVVSHEGDENSVFSAPVVEMMSGQNSVPMPDFESALGTLPAGSLVSVVAKGTVGNRSVHNIARIIRESCTLVALDLSAVSEFSHVFDSPFRGNPNLSAIIFPGNLLSISDSAFEDCKLLESVVIPKTVRRIGVKAFAGCDKLTSLEFADSEGWYAEKEGSKEEIKNLSKKEDNPYLFTLPSSPYRNCLVTKD